MASLSTALPSKRRVFVKKWAGFVSAIWLAIFSGYFTFSNYSSALKEVLGINQKLLNGLSNAMVAGFSCGGIIAGILSNFLPEWVLLCISASVGFLGYGIEWLVVSRSITPPPYWLMFIAETASGGAGCWIAVALLNASVRNFKQNRGPVAGLFKACMGLSAAVFVAVCDTLFSSSASAYLMMLVIVPTTFSFIAAIFFQPVLSAETQEEQEVEEISLRIFSVMACCLAVYVAILALLPTGIFNESFGCKVATMVLLFVVAGAPALVPIVLFSKLKESSEKVDDSQNEVVRSHEEIEAGFEKRIFCPFDDDSCPLLLNEVISDNPENQELNQPLLDNVIGKLSQETSVDWHCCEKSWSWFFWSVEELGVDTPTLSLLKTWHYYVLYFSIFCAGGSFSAFSNNLGQVGQSFGFSNTTVFTALFSLGSFSGMLASGNVSEYFFRMTNMPRPTWLGLTKLPSPFLYLWLSTGSTASLYVGSPLLGFSQGSLLTLSVPTISEFYGLKHFSTNFTVTNTSFLFGTFAFSTLAGYMYDRQALAGEKRNSLTCYGSECYGVTFQIMACCLTIALACDALLTLCSRPLYQKLKVSTYNTNSQ